MRASVRPPEPCLTHARRETPAPLALSSSLTHAPDTTCSPVALFAFVSLPSVRREASASDRVLLVKALLVTRKSLGITCFIALVGQVAELLFSGVSLPFLRD